MEQKYIMVYGYLLALEAELEGMKAENKDRELNNQSMAWNNLSFIEKAQEIRDCTNEIFK